MKTKQLLISLTLGLGLTLALLRLLPGSPLPMVQAQSGTRVIHVAVTGRDAPNCGPKANPCRTVQHAVDRAGEGYEIRVAAGTYTDVQSRPAPPGYDSPPDTIKQVVYINETITICGGYTTTNWTTPYPIKQRTTLDAQGQGRVLFITGNIHPTIEGLRIAGGSATGLRGAPNGEDAGGGVYVIAATATLSNNQVFGNTAIQGGGLYLHNSAATLSGNIVRHNEAKEGGGGLFLAEYSFASLTDNDITANTADRGGGLFLTNHSTATLSSSIIRANSARIGGGLDLITSTIWLTDNNVICNTARGGGGLRLSGHSTATLSGNAFISNIAGHAGGGLQLYDNNTAELSGNTFLSNTAYSDGGGLHLAISSTASLTGNTFIANIAGHNGGGLFLRDHSSATLSGNTFATNEARHGGGGLFVGDHSSATLSGDTIISNTVDAADYGGGGGLALTQSSTVACTNTIIADNRLNGPPGIGAGLLIADSSARLLHTTIARNGSTRLTAGSGGDGSGIHVTERLKTYSTVALTNTILVGHRVGITVTAGNRATLEATLWGTDTWANETDWDGAGTVITGTPAYNYWGDPAFVDPDAGDYHIGLSSAALDTGINAGVYDDIDGDVRPFDGDRNGVDESDFDIGADEFPAALGVTKQASEITASVGETITYTYMVTNTGNVRLTGVIADDDGLGAIRLFTTTLGPGQTTTGTATHTVVACDLLRSPLVNVVTVTGKPPTGPDVTDTDDASVYVRLCPSLPAFSAILLVFLSVVLRRKK